MGLERKMRNGREKEEHKNGEIDIKMSGMRERKIREEK